MHSTKLFEVLCLIWTLYPLSNCGITVREDSKHHDSVGKKFALKLSLSEDPSLFSLLWEDFLERNGQGSRQSDNVTAVEISNDSVNQHSGRGQQRMEEEFQKLRPGCEPNSYLTRTMKCRSCQKCGPDEVLLSPCATYRDAVCMQMPVKQPFAECADLFRRNHSKQLLIKYWTLLEKKIDHHHLHRCFKYMTDTLVQFSKMTVEQAKTVHRRAADSDDPDEKEKELKSTEKSQDREDIAKTTTEGYEDLVVKHGKAGPVDSNKLSNHESDDSKAKGLEPWVFIVIGIAVVILIVVPLAIGLIIRKRKLATQQQPVNKKQVLPSDPTGSVYDTQRSRSTDKGTERSRSTVSTYLSRDSRDTAGSYEYIPLQAIHNREKSSVIEMFEEQDEDLRACREYIPSSPHFQKVINTSRSVPTQPQPMDYARESRDMRFGRILGTSTERFLNTERSEENRLRGGSRSSDRRQVENFPESEREFVSPGLDLEQSCQSTEYRPPQEQGRKKSKSSSSTRSYISIPPTSPSENYIEAGADYTFVPSDHNMPQFEMTWLTKNLKGDAKNELSNYQASSGTQTDGSSDVTAPNSKTVFGTPWQFGGTFTSRGGVMQAKDSDVCLMVVPNAVHKGEYVHIYGAIFTDTTEIRKKLVFSDKESLITPVVEYTAVPVNTFCRQVCVQLPHALQEFDVNLIRVYTFTVDEQNKVSLHSVPFSSKTNIDRDSETSWERGPDGCTIHINTSHFSGYFCTLCDTSSLPSICTMVFGSHVQITQSRREVRVILYIWDRRLTIKDYLERFCKQESNVDRQLLTDMQIPLLDSASSESRLVMCMEVMGEDDDRRSWRHILRSDGSRPLFKPLQVRKLSEIVHCCRQTDPIRVEWALENVPNQIPSAVFQCCIDVMHVHESTSDYETAMREGSDDLMRTFYVRDLKVMTNSAQEAKPGNDFRRVDLKRMLSENMDIRQTEKLCQEFGITVKDIGNFRKKYSSAEEFQVGLVEECMRRHGLDRFFDQLPVVLERLHLTKVLTALEDKKIFMKDLKDLTAVAKAKTTQESVVPGPAYNFASDRDSTRQKSPYRRSPSPGIKNKSSSPPVGRKSWEGQRGNHRRPIQQQTSEKSDDVFVHSGAHQMQPHPDNSYSTDWKNGRKSGHSERNSRQQSPPYHPSSDHRGSYANSQNTEYAVSKYTHQNNEERQGVKNQKSSGSSDSVLDTRSEQSTNNASSYLSNHPDLRTSMFAHADPNDFKEQYPEEFLDDCLKQTYKKELLASKQLHGLPSSEYTPYLYARNELNFSDSGPRAIPPQSRQEISSSVSDPVPPYRKLPNPQGLYEEPHSSDKDQTSKKELYGIHTLV